MRKVILYIAMSLDGYIADARGGVDWLRGQDSGAETEDTYSEFIRDVDTVIMGWTTYHQITTELSPEEWVYQGLTSYVVTHRALESTEEVVFTQKSPCELVEALRREPGKKIWICGGADIVRQLLEADQIDEFCISVIPTVLGSGVRLFGTAPGELPLRLVRTREDNGIVELFYQRREAAL